MYIVVLEILIVVSSNFITVPVDLPYSCKFLFNSNSVFGSLDSTWCERSWRHRMSSRFLRYSRGYTSDFLLAIMMQFFFENCRLAGALWKTACLATLAQVMRQMKKSREIQWVEFFATKSRTSSEGGNTCDFRRVLATRQFSKKSHHDRNQKIARVAEISRHVVWARRECLGTRPER